MNPNYQIKETEYEADYNPLAIQPDAHFTQSYQYGEWQKSIDRDVRRFVIQKDDETIGTFQTITFKLPLKQNILCIPHGPTIKQVPDSDFLNSFGAFAKQLLNKEQAIFIRFDFFPSNLMHEVKFPRYIKKAPAHIYHSAYFQPRNEWVLDLKHSSEEEMLAHMHPKARYNASLAERKGITTEISKDLKTHFPYFWSLLQETATRDHFHLQPKIYYETVFRSSAEKQNAILAIARHNGKILAMNFVLCFGNTATFVYGGSSNEERNLMPSYLLQRETIREVKRLGYAYYNFGGITDGSKQYQSWEGFTVFKKKFGGEIRTCGESYDIVGKHVWYYLYDIQRRIKTLWRS